MVASVSFVWTGTFNHVFPLLSMHTLLSSKFLRETGIFSWKQRISLSSNFPLHANLVHRPMPVRGLGWHWLWGNWQPKPLNLGVPVLCRHARLINVKPITAHEKARANAILARAQALLWLRDCLHAWWGIFRRQKRTLLPLIAELYLIENHRHNYGQYLTTPFRTHSNNHFASFYSLLLNISIVGENSVYAHA
jgi:hypothetical protein